MQADFSQVASPSGPFEANVSLEDQNHAVVRSEGEDLASGIGELSVESSVADENYSRVREITEIKEHDAVEVGLSQTSGDVHPLVPVMPEPAAEQFLHSSSLSSRDSESSEDDLVDGDKSIQSGGNDMIQLPSVGESVIHHLPPEADVQDSQVSIFDLPSIAEKDLEGVEGHRTVIFPPATSGLTDSEVVEESNVRMFDMEQEPSARQKAAEEIGNDGLAMGIVSEGNNGDVSGGFPLIPTHDGGFPGSNVVELTQSTEFSTLPEVKSEPEMGSIMI